MVQIKKENAIMWEYKVGNNANIDNFVRLWKPRLSQKPESSQRVYVL